MRKRAVRHEQERRNSDMYSAWVHGPPRRGGRQDARARRVGGGQGDGGGYRAPSGGRFAGRASGRPQYGYGPRDLNHVPSERQTADILTKPLEQDTFARLRGELGVCYPF